MTHYSDRPSHVRAEFFASSGKWKYTAVLDMDGYWNASQFLTHEAVASAWRDLGRYLDLTCVVLDPYHEYEFPVMLTPDARERCLSDLEDRQLRKQGVGS